MCGVIKIISLAAETTSGANAFMLLLLLPLQLVLHNCIKRPYSTAILALPARTGVSCWIVKMMPNSAVECDIAHARRFYEREIAEIFSG